MRIRRRVIGLLVGGIGAAAASGGVAKPPTGPAIFSVDGLEQRCTKEGEECPVVVFVAPSKDRGGCVASVAVQTVFVTGSNTSIRFRLQKGPSDTTVYEFRGNGIIWAPPDADTKPDSSENDVEDPNVALAAKVDFNPKPSGSSSEIANWVSSGNISKGKPGHGDYYHYRPTVHIRGKSKNCKGNDPKIAND